MQPFKGMIVLLVSGFLVWGVMRTATASQTFLPEEIAPEMVGFNPLQPSSAYGITLMEASDTGLSLEFITPEFRIEQKSSHGQPCQVIKVEGYGENSNPHEPPLPVRGALVGIPLEGEPASNVIKGELVTLEGRYHLCPLELPVVNMDLR